MNNYNCEIVADSLNTFGNRITTFKLTYPRIVHAELMTHRMFSRNAASSRAVPVKKVIESVRNNMFTPLAVQKTHKGMQGSDYFEGVELEQAIQLWIESAELALQQAEKMEKLSITKQLINRILEPYQYYQVLVTATEFENFFKLRCPQYQGKFKSWRSWKDMLKEAREDKTLSKEDLSVLENNSIIDKLRGNKGQAEIHMMDLAEKMWDAINESTPKKLEAGDYHIPFEDKIDLENWYNNNKRPTAAFWNELEKYEQDNYIIKISTAMCARVSYTTIGDNKEQNYENDIKLHDVLLKNGHASPLEHIAQCMSKDEYFNTFKGLIDQEKLKDINMKSTNRFGWSRNIKGFKQYREIMNV